MAEKPRWDKVTLKLLRDNPSKYKEGTRYQTRIVQLFKDGKHAAIKVEVGEEGPNPKTGEVRFKHGSLAIADIKTLVGALPELEQLAAHPPAYPPELAAQADDIQF